MTGQVMAEAMVHQEGAWVAEGKIPATALVVEVVVWKAVWVRGVGCLVVGLGEGRVAGATVAVLLEGKLVVALEVVGLGEAQREWQLQWRVRQ